MPSNGKLIRKDVQSMAKRMSVEPVIPTDFVTWAIDTPDGTLEFTGKLLGIIDNERRGRPRWAEIELYKYLVTDLTNPLYGQQVYLLHTMGHSVVYHKHDSTCNRGVAVPVEEFPLRAEFPDDLEPCTDTIIRGNVVSKGCYPHDWKKASPGTVFDLELLRHTKITCATAEDVMQWLRRPSKKPCQACDSHGLVPGKGNTCQICHGKGYTASGEPTLTAPGQRLIEMARFRDADIAKAANKLVKL